MMEISGFGGMTPLTQMLATETGLDASLGTQDPLGGVTNRYGESASVSPLAQLMSGRAQLSTEQLAEADAFRNEVRNSLGSGDFDASALAGKAPDFLQQRAAENGISLEDAFSQLGARINDIKARIGSSLAGSVPSAFDPSQLQIGSDRDAALETLLAALGGDEEN